MVVVVLCVLFPWFLEFLQIFKRKIASSSKIKNSHHNMPWHGSDADREGIPVTTVPGMHTCVKIRHIFIIKMCINLNHKNFSIYESFNGFKMPLHETVDPNKLNTAIAVSEQKIYILKSICEQLQGFF